MFTKKRYILSTIRDKKVQDSKYGSVPSSMVQLAGLGSIYMSLIYNIISLSLLQGISEWV